MAAPTRLLNCRAPASKLRNPHPPRGRGLTKLRDRSRNARLPLLELEHALQAAAGHPPPGGRLLPRVRQPGRLEGAGGPPGGRLERLDRSRRARRARARRLPHPSPYLGRARSDRLGLPVLRRLAARLGGAAAGAARAGPGPDPDAPGGGRGDAADDLRALADHRPARPRHRPATEHGADPSGRGPAAPVPGRDGRRDRVERRRDQARIHLPGAGRLRPRRVGVELPQRAPARPGTRRAHDRRPPRRLGAGRR